MRHSLRISTAGFVFQRLRITATLFQNDVWWPIYQHPSPHAFELEHGLEVERDPYNARCLAQALRGKTVHGEHAGMADWFVPIADGKRVRGVLVVGPFSKTRPTASEISSRWRWLTGRQGHPSDPEFAKFLSTVLGTLVVEGQRFEQFRELLEAMAGLMASDDDAEKRADEVEALRLEVTEARVVDMMWDAAQEMVDDRTARSWSSPNYADDVKQLGLKRMPDQVLVGLALSKGVGEAVEEAVRRYVFQRRCGELARSLGNVVAGRVGDQGVFFGCAFTGSKDQRKHKLQNLMDRAAALAQKEFGLSLHFGSSAAAPSLTLPACYQEAMGAADRALSQGVKYMVSARGSQPTAHSLRRLRRELVEAVERNAGVFSARFDGYLETVAIHTAHRVDLARAHLDAGFESVAALLLRSGALDEASFASLSESLERAVSEAATTAELGQAYRRAVADVTEASKQPVAARQGRSLRRALNYIDRHYGEPLGLSKVAAVAGFAPKYFSHLFRERQKVTFEAYVTRVRVERAKSLLLSTDLKLGRVAELSGFRSAQYFCHVFKKSAGSTAIQFRTRRARERAKRGKRD